MLWGIQNQGRFFATIFESLVNKYQLLKTVRFPTELCDKVWVTVYFKCSVHFCGHHIYQLLICSSTQRRRVLAILLRSQSSQRYIPYQGQGRVCQF
jgi:hypothetical protein